MKIKLDENAFVPTRGTEDAAGYDLYANTTRPIEICLGNTEIIRTGVHVEIPKGYFGGVFARSGLSTKKGLRPAGCVGIIDCDYRGEICVALHNDGPHSVVHINHGDRIAQLVLIPCLTPELEVVDSLNNTARGEHGFGSTGR